MNENQEKDPPKNPFLKSEKTLKLLAEVKQLASEAPDSDIAAITREQWEQILEPEAPMPEVQAVGVYTQMKASLLDAKIRRMESGQK